MVTLYGGGEALEAPGWSNTFRTFSNFWSRNIFSKTTIARSPTRRRNLAYIGCSQLMRRLWPELSWDITNRNIRYKVFNSCLGYYFSNIVIGHKNCSSTVLADCCCVTLMIASQSVAGTWELPESCNWTSPSCLWLCDFVPSLLAACSSSLNLQTSWLTLVTHDVLRSKILRRPGNTSSYNHTCYHNDGITRWCVDCDVIWCPVCPQA